MIQTPRRGSIYERWVTTVRAWAREPESTSLLELPALEETTFTPDTYRRLVEHLLDAMRQADERWHRGLARAWGNSSTAYELAREMVALRTALARRLQLAKHPGLPEPIREVLVDGLTKDIERYQQEIEEAVRRQRSPTSLDSGWRDQMLAVVRENSFLAVLRYDVMGRQPQADPLPEHDRSAPEVMPVRTSTRRVVIPGSPG